MDLSRSLYFSFMLSNRHYAVSTSVTPFSGITRNMILCVWCIYVDYSHFMSPNRGVEGYIRLANSRDNKHPSLPPPPQPPSQLFTTEAAAAVQKQPKLKSKSSMNLIKPNRKQFTQVCTWTVHRWWPLRWRMHSAVWQSLVMLLLLLLMLWLRQSYDHACVTRVRMKIIFCQRPLVSPECSYQWIWTFVVRINGLVFVRCFFRIKNVIVNR